MITYKCAYGIPLTDKFGYVLKKCEYLFEAIETTENLEKNQCLASHPSDDSDQYILGFFVALDKKMDFKKIHQEWEDMMKKTPQNIQDLAKGFEPNIYIMAGNI